jgi:hypothetical protein
LTFYDFPAEHWRHLRTTNIIESPFATVRLRQRVTKGAGSRTKALMMAFKLLAMAEERWRKVNGSELLPLVRTGVRFVDGVQEKPQAIRLTSTTTLGGKAGWAPASRLLVEARKALIKETVAPLAGDLPWGIQACGDNVIGQSLRGQEDQLGPDDVSIR